MDTSKFSIWEFFLFNHWDVFPIPVFPPYDVQTLHFMETPTMGSITRLWGVPHAIDVLHGGLGDSLKHVWGAPRRPWRVQFGQVRFVAAFGAGSGCRGGQRVAQDAGGHGAATRARRYAHSGAEDKGAENSGKRNICSAFVKGLIFGPDAKRAKRYAQQRILNMSALKHIMLITVFLPTLQVKQKDD